ncbi:Putative zn(2)Cys(6) fungal-type DNA-binding domain-containing protein [Colletotrichum destructivum]|uniref:Zn(2)Cys(6) fungal-type DNA-binding domain-containing protein n=1 Tax=Colletotrichum destructivum TaxID=34406 RepID=A0AAX4I1Y8_9PEZI|nr:Putative zn(2)Cys(6) fungal-type DNA-binding domain-containing protein [Colletotrichum destructivum]
MSKRLALLLPAGNGGGRSSVDSSREEHSKRKRVSTDTACNACRRRKTRCDGTCPACAACRKRSTECIYVEKKESPRLEQPLEVSQEVLELLRSASEPQAFGMLRMLRANDDSNSVLNTINGGMDGMTWPFDHGIGRATLPTQLPLEFELMVKNPVAYPAPRHAPLRASECRMLLEPSRLRRSKSLGHYYCSRLSPFDHADLRSGLRSAENYGQHLNYPFEDGTTTKPTNSAPPCDNDNTFHLEAPPSETPERSRKSIPVLCDERLRKLKIDFWTDVPVTDDFAARVISLYLTTDHPLLGIFDPHLFITDLVGQRQKYCSRLLVNALMYWGCQMYTAIEEKTVHYIEPFCKETERLWLLEKDNTSILNAASAQLLSLSYLGHGKDHHVLEYLAVALRMGTRLSLFGVEAPQAKKNLERMSRETVTSSPGRLQEE